MFKAGTTWQSIRLERNSYSIVLPVKPQIVFIFCFFKQDIKYLWASFWSFFPCFQGEAKGMRQKYPQSRNKKQKSTENKHWNKGWNVGYTRQWDKLAKSERKTQAVYLASRVPQCKVPEQSQQPVRPKTDFLNFTLLFHHQIHVRELLRWQINCVDFKYWQYFQKLMAIQNIYSNGFRVEKLHNCTRVAS